MGDPGTGGGGSVRRNGRDEPILVSFIQKTKQIPESHEMQHGGHRMPAPPGEFFGHGTSEFDIESRDSSPFVRPDCGEDKRSERLHRQANLDAPAVTDDVDFTAGDRPHLFDCIDE